MTHGDERDGGPRRTHAHGRAADGAPSPLLEARGVEVEIAGTPILRGADLSVQSGELVAVVGPNGAGKSTLVRAVSGLQKPSAGERRLVGPARWPSCAAASWPACAPSCRSGCRCRPGSACAKR